MEFERNILSFLVQELKGSKLKTPLVPENMKAFVAKYPHTKELVIFNESLDEEINYQGYKVRFISFLNITAF